MYVTQKFRPRSRTRCSTRRQPPFNDIRMRKALAMGADRNEINNITNNGLPTVADGPFAPGSVGYLKDPASRSTTSPKAKKLVQEYVKGGGNGPVHAELARTTRRPSGWPS